MSPLPLSLLGNRLNLPRDVKWTLSVPSQTEVQAHFCLSMNKCCTSVANSSRLCHYTKIAINNISSEVSYIYIYRYIFFLTVFHYLKTYRSVPALSLSATFGCGVRWNILDIHFHYIVIVKC